MVLLLFSFLPSLFLSYFLGLHLSFSLIRPTILFLSLITSGFIELFDESEYQPPTQEEISLFEKNREIEWEEQKQHQQLQL